jgi:hypothetical protein
MRERWNKLWAKFTSHRAWRKVREKAAMILTIVTYRRHVVNVRCVAIRLGLYRRIATTGAYIIRGNHEKKSQD